MQKILTAFFAAAILLGPSAWAGTIYKCKSPQGALLYQEKPCAAEIKSVSSWVSSSASTVDDDADTSSPAPPLVIGQGSNGNYYVHGLVNDQDMNFVIDTGASYLTLPQEMASSAGVSCQRQGMMQTANGATRVCSTIIRKFKFGRFTIRDVEAVIAPNLRQPLLGMNVLKRFRIEQDNGEMRLSKKD